MAISEEEKRQLEDKAISYQTMFSLWAWKDFESYLDRLRASTLNDFINLDQNQGVEFKAGQYKGILDCLNRIKKELERTVAK